jgi:hypothetical protein
MAAAVLIAGGLRIFLPDQLRLNDARPLFIAVLAVLMVALIVGDPGRIDRQKTWLRVLTGVLIGVITVINAGHRFGWYTPSSRPSPSPMTRTTCLSAVGSSG